MPPKKTPPDCSRCPQCGMPLQETSYRWNPDRGDFDVFVSCPVCVAAEAPQEAPKRPAAPAARGAKQRT